MGYVKRKLPSRGPAVIPANAACECKHPYAEHLVSASNRNGECVNYDPLAKPGSSPWCNCAEFRIVPGKILEPYRVSPEKIRAAEEERRAWDTRRPGIPAKNRKAALVRNMPVFDRYGFQAPKAEFEIENMSAETAALLFGKSRYWPKPESAFGRNMYEKAKTAPRPSKKTRTKTKRSKTAPAQINKLTLTRVNPVLDEEV